MLSLENEPGLFLYDEEAGTLELLRVNLTSGKCHSRNQGLLAIRFGRLDNRIGTAKIEW
jgi:hypothetical protein